MAVAGFDLHSGRRISPLQVAMARGGTQEKPYPERRILASPGAYVTLYKEKQMPREGKRSSFAHEPYDSPGGLAARTLGNGTTRRYRRLYADAAGIIFLITRR
jgi:hypothetical protein